MATHRIPNLELHLSVVDVDHARPKLYADGEIVDGLKPLVRKLQEQA